jgi:hypothetical protein
VAAENGHYRGDVAAALVETRDLLVDHDSRASWASLDQVRQDAMLFWINTPRSSRWRRHRQRTAIVALQHGTASWDPARPAGRAPRDLLIEWAAKQSPAVHGLRSLIGDTLAGYLQRPRGGFFSWKNPSPGYLIGPFMFGPVLVLGGLWGLIRFKSVATSLGELAVGLPLLMWFVLYAMRPVGPQWWADDEG